MERKLCLKTWHKSKLKKDYKCDFISDDDYDDFKHKYLYEVNKLNLEKESLCKDKINSYNLEWINQFKKIGKLKIWWYFWLF